MKIRSEALPYTSYLPCSNIEVQIYMYNLSRISLYFSCLSNTPIITKATPINAFKSRVNSLATSDGLGIPLPIQEVRLVMTPFPFNQIYQLTHWPLQRNNTRYSTYRGKLQSAFKAYQGQCRTYTGRCMYIFQRGKFYFSMYQ